MTVIAQKIVTDFGLNPANGNPYVVCTYWTPDQLVVDTMGQPLDPATSLPFTGSLPPGAAIRVEALATDSDAQIITRVDAAIAAAITRTAQIAALAARARAYLGHYLPVTA